MTATTDINRQSGPPSARIASIDVLRGLTMAVMIFVNDLDGVNGLPWWTRHAKAEQNVMTYVDMVFPFFLFSLGLSLPIAIRQRLKKNPSLPALWGHTLLRSICLVVLGVILANAREGDPALMHLPSFAWTLLALLGVSLYLSVYNGNERHVALYRSLRIAGLILTIVMLTLFRRITQDGRVAWLDFSYLEILGLLGCTYFAVSLLYIPTRRWPWAPTAWFVLLTGFSVLCAARWFVFERHVPLYLWPFGDGTMAFIAMAGVVTANIFFGERSKGSPGYKLLVGSCFGMALLVAGRIFTSLGISKIRDTPTWGLYSTGAAVLLFTFLFWLCDVRRHTTWASFVRPAGANTLLTYLLPDYWFFLISLTGFTWFDSHFNQGLIGTIGAALFTGAILTLAAQFTRLRIRLQL
jgi:heparan-alpha-glucosaminide N-acetyltransferase